MGSVARLNSQSDRLTSVITPFLALSLLVHLKTQETMEVQAWFDLQSQGAKPRNTQADGF